MNLAISACLLIWGGGMGTAPPAPSPLPADTVHVEIVTELGSIRVFLEEERAPRTVANFLAYVDGGHYENGSFYRTVTMENQPDDSVRIEVIQGGADTLRADFRHRPPIPIETTTETGLRHRDGTISMARREPHSATHMFFITIGDQPELDHGGARNPDGYGFAAFGHVVEGMDVVRRIQARPAEGQSLVEPVGILDIRRVQGEPERH
jgi:peptidyl-prolyl cis-trans isomerase A (cyclophilin A)